MSNPNFNPQWSTNDIWRNEDQERCLTDDLDLMDATIAGKADSNHTHSGYAKSNHSHSGYASVSDLEVLEGVISTKADSIHTHDDYATTIALDTLASEIDGKANVSHSHTEYSPLIHSHDDYATVVSLNEISTIISGKANTSHSHDDKYYTETEIDTKLANKADATHNHNSAYDTKGSASSALTSANAYTDSKIDALVGEGASTTLDTIGEISAAIEENQDAIDLLNSAIANKANVAHNHDDVYYTETEVDTLLSGKSDSSHTHNYVPTSRTVNGKSLSSNIVLTASDVGALSSDVDIPSALSDLTGDSTHRVVTDAEKATWNAKSNFSGSYNDLTNKPSIPSISGLATETYVDEAVSTKANSSHTHTIANITNLQTTLDGKASSSHNHDTVYYTQTQIDTKDGATLDSAKEYADGLNTAMDSRMDSVESKLSTIASGAEVNQNAFGNVVVGTTTIVADAKTDSLTIASGTGISVTADATNDKVTITNSGVRSIATGSSNGTISVNTNGTSANVAVKGLGSAAYTASTAYDAAGTAQTKANDALVSAKAYADGIKNDLLNNAGAAYDTLKELGDLIDDNTDAIDALETVAASKANASDLTSHTSNKSNPHGVTLAQLGVTATATELNSLDGITATVTELNYVDGVTSNIQTQLNAKASSSHTHNYAGSSSAGGAATSANKLNTSDGSATQPVYFANGIPVKTTYTLGKSVPSDAKFTDTTYGVATTSANGLMSATDKVKLNAMELSTVAEVESYLGI